MALSSSPTYAIPGELTTLAFTTTTSANEARWNITSVPDGSAIETGYLLDDAGEYIDTFTPDVAGAYGVRADLYRHVIGYTQFVGDPAGAERTLYKESQSSTIYVSDVLDLPIRTIFGHGATLRLEVSNATVRAAELVDTLTEESRTAALDATVIASLAALVDVAVTAIEDKLETTVQDLDDALAAHRVSAVHNGTDTVNVTVRDPPYSNPNALDTLNELYDNLVAHMTTGVWHDSHGQADTKNYPACGKASNYAQGVVLSADLRYRVYDRHRVQISNPISHTGSGDTVNTLTAAKPLAALMRDYLDAITSLVFSAPTGEQSGAALAERLFGFVRAPS